jgi:hypothetical protein
MIAANTNEQPIVAALAALTSGQRRQVMAVAAGLHAHAEGSEPTKAALTRIASARLKGDA